MSIVDVKVFGIFFFYYFYTLQSSIVENRNHNSFQDVLQVIRVAKKVRLGLLISISRAKWTTQLTTWRQETFLGNCCLSIPGSVNDGVQISDEVSRKQLGKIQALHAGVVFEQRWKLMFLFTKRLYCSKSHNHSVWGHLFSIRD